ncbi:hypothetical protein N836_03645 [Leptolyngbya sp. Heron Island J]|nr:hypothetical protein N836_03645 [Leptolyngbya sp. Heron Island J]
MALTQAIIQEAKNIGCSKMRLDTGVYQIASQKLYQKLGFKPKNPYYALSDNLRNALIFMELNLSETSFSRDRDLNFVYSSMQTKVLVITFTPFFTPIYSTIRLHFDDWYAYRMEEA